MRTVKRFMRRLGAWAARQDADERLAAEIEDHLALPDRRIRARRAVAGGGAAAGGPEVWRGRRDQRTLAGGTRAAGARHPRPGHSSRAASPATGAGVHDRDGAGPRARHRRDNGDLHARPRRAVEVASSAGTRRAVSPGPGSALLLLGWLHPVARVFARLLPTLYAAPRQDAGLCGAGGLLGRPGPLGRAACRQRRASRNLSGRVRLWQLLRDVRCTRPTPGARWRQPTIGSERRPRR